MDYKELIELSRKAAAEWHGTHEYYQAAVLIESLCDAVETLRAEREAAVAVVRCKDCKHCILTGRPPFMYHACNRLGAIRAVDEDDFCKYGTPPNHEKTERCGK